jgi:hypothetical protein
MSLLRSLEFFRQAYTNNPDLGSEAAILMMTLAFEILLDFGNRKDFRDKLGSLCGVPGEKSKSYKVKDSRTGNVWTEQLTEKQIWANEFYELRNSIAHGDTVDPEKYFFNGEGHFKLAILFFRMCVRGRLESVAGAQYECSERLLTKPDGKFEFSGQI